jgi:hypothetical protein
LESLEFSVNVLLPILRGVIIGVVSLLLADSPSVWADPPEGGPGGVEDDQGNEPPAPEPELPPALTVGFSLPMIEAHPGDILDVPVTIDGSDRLSLVAVSIELDPARLELVDVVLSPEVAALLEQHPEAHSEFIWFADAAEGWAQAALVLDFEAREELSLPAGPTSVLLLKVRVLPDASPGESTLSFARPESARFESKFHGKNGQVYNSVRRHGKPFTADDEFEDEEAAPALSDGYVSILPLIGDVGIFRRGDANIDRQIDVSDPIVIVTHLFLGATEPLLCEDAADANDDGSIDVSDPISILGFLYGGAAAIDLSSAVLSRDATEDSLSCGQY